VAIAASSDENDTVQATMIVPELPLSAVNKPTVLLPSARLDYRVKLESLAIARKHDISLKEIVNKMTAPRSASINQRLIIPGRHSSTVGLGATWTTLPYLAKVATIDNSAVLNTELERYAVISRYGYRSDIVCIVINCFSIRQTRLPGKAGDTLSAIARKSIFCQKCLPFNKLPQKVGQIRSTDSCVAAFAVPQPS